MNFGTQKVCKSKSVSGGDKSTITGYSAYLRRGELPYIEGQQRGVSDFCLGVKHSDCTGRIVSFAVRFHHHLQQPMEPDHISQLSCSLVQVNQLFMCIGMYALQYRSGS